LWQFQQISNVPIVPIPSQKLSAGLTTLAYLEPSYIEDELQKGEQRKLKVADKAVIQLVASYQTRQHGNGKSF